MLFRSVYRLILKDANDVTYFDKDRVSSIGSGDYKVLTFNTIADLRLKIGSEKEPTAQTSGYYVAGDGGGNSFYWDGASGATDNGGSIIKPTFVVGAGRWIAIDLNNLNPKQFGAKANGVYDDTSHIISYAAVSSSLFFVGNAGDIYTLSTPITIYSSSVFIASGVVVKALSSFSGAGMFILGSNTVSAADVVMQGAGTIDCNRVASLRGVYAVCARRTNIELNIINCIYIAIEIGSVSAFTSSYECFIQNNQIINTRYYDNAADSVGVYFNNCTDSAAVNVITVGYRTGFKNEQETILFLNCHPWTTSEWGPMEKGFWARSATRYIGCYADTPTNKINTGSDGSITDVYGFYLDAYNCFLQNCIVLLNQAHSTDNICTAIYCTKTDGMFGSITDAKFLGGTTAKYKKLIGYNGSSITPPSTNITSAYSTNTSIYYIQGYKNNILDRSGSNSSFDLYTTNGTDSSYNILNDGINRWGIKKVGSTNNFQIVRYDSSGVLAGIPFTVNSTSGQAQVGENGISGAGVRLNTGTASTVGVAGGASALPATPTGYAIINVNGTDYKMPYYNL